MNNLVENIQWKLVDRMGGDQLTGRVDCWGRVDWGDELIVRGRVDWEGTRLLKRPT